jgi:hypothetical protein
MGMAQTNYGIGMAFRAWSYEEESEDIISSLGVGENPTYNK